MDPRCIVKEYDPATATGIKMPTEMKCCIAGTVVCQSFARATARATTHVRRLKQGKRGLRGLLVSGNLSDLEASGTYPESGLRPSGDIDLWNDPEQRQTAEAIARDLKLTQALDLDHDQLQRFENRGFAEFYASSDTAQLGSIPVKILRREDQVRILSLHFLKHGGWRPIWLCDIAVILESKGGTFDWERCLGANTRRARWIGCTIALTRDLLDARIPDGAPLNMTSDPRPEFEIPIAILRKMPLHRGHGRRIQPCTYIVFLASA